MNRKMSSSTSSLLSDYSSNGNGNRKRASMGFMRSSFVLKKEMEELGLDVPANGRTSTSITDVIPEETADETPYHSTTELPVRRKSTPVESFQYLSSVAGSESTITPAEAKPTYKEKKSFGSKLRSVFSKSKNTEPTEEPVRPYSVKAVPANGNGARYPSSVQSSRATSTTYGTAYETVSERGSVSQFSELDSPRQPKTVGTGYGAHNHSTGDIRSSRSSLSGFSLLGKDNGSKRTSTRTSYITSTTRTGNKYKVKAVPYNVFSRGV